jgi:signal peptidase I
MAYNGPQGNKHWVGDLMIDCEVTVDKAEGQLVFELSRGTDRFRAFFDLASGDCTLKRIARHTGKDAPADDAGEELRTAHTDLKKPGTYQVRFANVDQRLLVWVDKSLPFGDEGVPYPAPQVPGPHANDLEPASIGVRGAGVTVGKLQLYRDTYYTQMLTKKAKDEPGMSKPEVATPANPEGYHGGEDVYPSVSDWTDPSAWGELQSLKPRTLYVQPGHYLCMGDNSPHSSDGRAWGLVPERLMLGRALVVYYPFWPFGTNRIKAIH